VSNAVALLTCGYISRVKRAVEQARLDPTAAQNLLIKSLELPLPAELTQAIGIHQSDVVLRSSLVAALADLRANPWLLEYVFASLPSDALTWKEYGEKSVQAAKDWFLRTNVAVLMEPVLDELKAPAITIQLVDSQEVQSEATLGDIHSSPTEGNNNLWPALTGPLTPTSYSPATGIVVLPEGGLPAGIYVGPGMFIVDAVGRSHEIIEVYDQQSFRISSGTVADFRNSILKSHRPAFITHLESSSYRETYRIGVHVNAEPSYLTWLHSIVVFCLLRYKQALLEARGFERSSFQSSDFARETQMETELLFSRYITISGFCRQVWPKAVARVIDVVTVDTESGAIKVSGENADVKMEGTGVDPRSSLWTGNKDE
jgi:hypothetical protein